LAVPKAATSAPTITAFHRGTVIAPELTITVQRPAAATAQLRPGVGLETAEAKARTVIAIAATASSALTASLLVEISHVATSSQTPSAQFSQLSVFIGKCLP
jgi:hypothetical protein